MKATLSRSRGSISNIRYITNAPEKQRNIQTRRAGKNQVGGKVCREPGFAANE